MNRFLPLLAVAVLYAGCNKADSPVAPDGSGGGLEKDYAFPGEKGLLIVNGDNTRITFVGSKSAGKREGGFKSVSGEISFLSIATGAPPPPPDKRTTVNNIHIEIDADSLWSDDDKLTQQLKSDDFLQAKAHPKITFQSTKFEQPGGHEGLTVTGDLTLRGVTKSITFPLKVTRQLGAHIAGDFKINRKDFGMTRNLPTAPIDDEVNVTVRVGHEPAAPKS